jgi:hypothetical protein
MTQVITDPTVKYSSASYIGTINITNPITNTHEAEILKGLTE